MKFWIFAVGLIGISIAANTCGHLAAQESKSGPLPKRLEPTVTVGQEVNLMVGTHKQATKFKIEKGPSSISISNGGKLTWTPLSGEVGPQQVVVAFRVKGKTRRVTMETEVVRAAPAARESATPAVTVDDSGDLSDTIRTWTSKDGRYSVKAKLLDVSNGTVTLLRVDNDKKINIPVETFSEQDRDFAISWVHQRRVAEEGGPTLTIGDSMPVANASDDVRVVEVDPTTVELHPYGRISKFAQANEWFVDRKNPVKFSIRNLAEGFTLDVSEPARTQADKRRILQHSYDALMAEIAAADFKVTQRTVLDRNKELRSGVQYVATATHPGHGIRHVTTRIRFDDDHTFIFQVSGASEARVTQLVKLSDSFVRGNPSASSIAATATSPSMDKSSPQATVRPAADARPIPKADKIAIKKVGDYEYRLDPFGVMGLPKPDFKWRVLSKDPPVFVSENPDRSQWLRLTVMTAIGSDQESRDALLANRFKSAMSNVREEGAEIMDVMEHAHTDADALMFRVGGAADGRRFEREGILRFHEDYTYFFEVYSAGDNPNAGLLSQTSKFFLTDIQAAKLPKPNLPKEVVESLSKEIEKLKGVMDMKNQADVESMVRYTMSAGELDQLKASGDFDAIVKRVLEQTGPELLYSLKTINWKRVEYEPDTDTVRFQNPPFGTEFTRENGKWKMRM